LVLQKCISAKEIDAVSMVTMYKNIIVLVARESR